jgi:hypothetical protein
MKATDFSPSRLFLLLIQSINFMEINLSDINEII